MLAANQARNQSDLNTDYLSRPTPIEQLATHLRTPVQQATQSVAMQALASKPVHVAGAGACVRSTRSVQAQRARIATRVSVHALNDPATRRRSVALARMSCHVVNVPRRQQAMRNMF